MVFLRFLVDESNDQVRWVEEERRKEEKIGWEGLDRFYDDGKNRFRQFSSSFLNFNYSCFSESLSRRTNCAKFWREFFAPRGSDNKILLRDFLGFVVFGFFLIERPRRRFLQIKIYFFFFSFFLLQSPRQSLTWENLSRSERMSQP